MLVVPNAPHPESTGSERKVLKLLRNVDWGGGGARALNSLNLPDHLYQRWGEIDFLIIGSPGLVAIEVKGGDVSCSGGYWRYEDRLGRVVKRSKSPVVQAKDAYFSLIENYVAGPMGRGFATSVPTGFCVLLAGAGKSELGGLLGTPELPEELTGTREDLVNAGALGSFLRRVAKYWQDKSGARSTISPGDVAKLVGLLRPEFEKVRPLALSRDQSREELIHLTEEQYEALDHWDGADRILCTAPAGCGKTLLAVELFRRAKAGGQDVLLLCGADNLARAIAASVGDRTRVLSLDEVESMASTERPRADILIVDEGQQAFSASRMSLLDQMVVDGLEGGRWAWFGDPNHQLPVSAEVAEAALLRLRQASSVQPKLRKNCRNTPEIVRFAELASGVLIGHAITKGRGVAPRTEEVRGAAQIAGVIASQVNEWRREEIRLSEMCVLVAGGRAEELAQQAGALGNFGVAQWSPGGSASEVVRYCEVEEFRGLESPFLILCIPEFNPDDQALARMFYIATTRANFALTMIAPAAVMDRFKRFVESSLKETGD